MTIEVATGAWGVAMSLAPLLQVRRMLRQRSSRGVSLAYLTVLEIGFGLYLAYGLSIDNAVLIVTNVVSLLTNTTTLVVAAALAPGDAMHQPQPSQG